MYKLTSGSMLNKISTLVRDKKCSTFEALLMIIEEQDLEPSEVIKELPPSIVEKLKQDAISDGKLRPSMIEAFSQTFSINDFFH